MSVKDDLERVELERAVISAALLWHGARTISWAANSSTVVEQTERLLSDVVTSLKQHRKQSASCIACGNHSPELAQQRALIVSMIRDRFPAGGEASEVADMIENEKETIVPLVTRRR